MGENISHDSVVIPWCCSSFLRPGPHRWGKAGQEEGGKWWYAGSRLSCNVFTIWAKRGKRRPLYMTYVTGVLEQTPFLVIAMVQHVLLLLGKKGLMEGVREAHFWTDAGPHFRAYQMLWWWCVCVPETWKINTIFSFFTEHHGKGILDRFRGPVPWHGSVDHRGTVPWHGSVDHRGQFRVRFLVTAFRTKE